MNNNSHFQVDKLTVYVCDTREAMGRAAYEFYRDRVCALLQEQPLVRAIYAAAHSQDEFLHALVADTDIDFARIDAFHMDEYFGLGESAPQKFGHFLTERLFARKPFARVNLIRSEAPDIEAEARRYEALLRQCPIDITSLGIGENGHIAFNDPHEARFDDPCWVRRTTLDDTCRQQQVNDGEFGSLNEVPTSAYTLTVPALMASRILVGIVPNGHKAEAVRRTLCEPVSEACPASILRTHDDAVLFLDRDAAALL